MPKTRVLIPGPVIRGSHGAAWIDLVRNEKTFNLRWDIGTYDLFAETEQAMRAILLKRGMDKDLMAWANDLRSSCKRYSGSYGLCYGAVNYIPPHAALEIFEIVHGHYTAALKKLKIAKDLR